MLQMVFPAEGATLRDSIVAIQEGGMNISLALDEGNRLVGVVSDGDIRRALLSGCGLDDPIAGFIQHRPYTVGPSESRTSVLDLMQSRDLSQVPVVDASGRLVGLHSLRELLGKSVRPHIAMILAGGRGTRLMPITAETPKPMIEVAGRPILERIVTHLVGFGIRRIALSVGYLSEPIERHFGRGDRFGCEIKYLREDPLSPLGTGGPVGKLIEAYPEMNEPVLVLNGDLITQFDVAGLFESHTASGAAITVGVVTYTHEVPFGVIATNPDGFVRHIAEKPVLEQTVSAGIYVLQPEIVMGVPRGQFVPMTQIITECVTRGQRVGVWNCGHEWSDIGRPLDLARALGHS